MSARAASPALNVRWHDGRLVGRVVTSGTTYFAYDEAWLATALDLSPLVVPLGLAEFSICLSGYIYKPAKVFLLAALAYGGLWAQTPSRIGANAVL